MANQTRTKNIWVDVIVQLTSTVEFSTASLILTGQPFGFGEEIGFNTASLVLTGNSFSVQRKINFEEATLRINGQTFDPQFFPKYIRSFFFHF